MTDMLVQAKGFDVSRYIGNDANSPTSFALRENHIAKLPYVEGGVVDIYDISIDAADYSGYRLVLRLTRLRKTFYIVNKKRKITKKIGAWYGKPDDGIYPPGFIGLKQVRDQFKDLVAQKEATKDDKLNVAEMTIKEYMRNYYETDRQKTPIKSGIIKPVREDTIKGMISVFSPWLDKKIGEAKNTWPQDFKDYWLTTPRYNAANWKTTTLKTESMRKYYTYLNAMFGVCVKRGYIAKNPIDGYTHLFERTKSEMVIAYDYDYEEVVSFIFSDEVEELLSHKLIVASMIASGARNSEIYKNYRENFRTAKREIYIPGHISKNKNVDRTIPVESDLYWEKVDEYLANFETNQHGHMFPSRKARSGHVTNNAYRDVWEAVKKKYNLKSNARLYNNRSTYGTRLAKEQSLHIAAKMLGDSLETTAKYYLQHDADAARGTLKKLFNKKVVDVNERNPQPTSQPKIDSREMATLGKMPPSIDDLFQQFLGGKDVSIESGIIDKVIWLQFVSKIRSRSEKGKTSEEENDWLEMISE